MLLRSLGSFATLRVATLLRSLVWVGVGGHVNVPRTSYRIYCHVSVGWGWGGVGWGGMLTFLVLRKGYIAMLLRFLGSFTTLHVATLLVSLR